MGSSPIIGRYAGAAACRRHGGLRAISASDHQGWRDSNGMLLIIAGVLLLFWVGGLAFRIAGGLIHVLLVIAAIVIVLHFLHAGG